MAKPDPYQKAVAARASKMERVVFTVDASVIARFDEWAVGRAHTSRAEALRAVIDLIVPEKAEGGAL